MPECTSCSCQRWAGKPVMDIQLITKSLTDAKELIQSLMEELKKRQSWVSQDSAAMRRLVPFSEQALAERPASQKSQ